MALGNPLSAADLADLLKVVDVKFVQDYQQQRSASGGGETHYSDRAPSLWIAELTTAPLDIPAAEGIMARINSRAGGLKTAILYNNRLPFPPDDPDGLIIDGLSSSYLQTWLPWSDELEWNDSVPWGGGAPGPSSPKLGVITDRLHVAFTGFPPFYKLRAGTYFGIVFDGSRYYLGQLAESRVANGSGAVATVEILPPLPSSVAGALSVSVKKPPAKFRFKPGSAFPSSVGERNSKITFSAEQTYSP